MRTCGACGTGGQADTASFCFGCGSALVAPGCASCGAELPANARFCPSCGAPSGAAVAPATVRAVEVTPSARSAARKITSVLFGDLVGFTTLSEARDPEEVRELLTAYFDECRAVVDRYGGELEKFIGDAVMAVWGLPVTREDDAERAVRAGLELVEQVTALGERIGMPGLAMRVGITTAEVAVTLGATGQGMVAGDAVNTAARIQATAPPGEVWVDDTTRSFTTAAIAYDDAGEHAMKGKAEPVPLWTVRAVVAGVGGDRRDDGLEAPLIGRDRELRLVKEVFHQVQEAMRPGLLVVDGEAGVGKSRLGWEFEKYVDGLEGGVLWHRGRCLSYGEGVAYYALTEAVRSRVAVLAGADESGGADSSQLLHRALDACVPDQSDREWLAPRLAALLGLESGANFPREDLFVAWTVFFKYVGLSSSGATAPEPVVLVIDDAQYADEGLLAFLEHLLSAADFPVFILALTRPELFAEHPDLVGNRRVTVVHLEPLSALDMGRLFDGVISGIPEPLRDELVSRAEGIPLFAIETVRSLIDQDLVAARDGHHVLTDPAAIDPAALSAPASLQALIAARLDTLPPDERRVVDRASVLGLVFTTQGIAALCADVADLDRVLASLFRREVLRRETDRLSTEFGNNRFVQGAVRQVAYGMLSRRDRKATHLTVTGVLETELESHAESSGELAPVIAQHYLDAIDAVPGDPDVLELTRAASDHLERAADRAAALGAPREAAGHLAKALIRCEPERRLTIQSRLSRQLVHAGDHAATIEHASEALKGFEAAGDAIAAAAPAADLVRALALSNGDLTLAGSVVREQLERLPDTPETLDARMALVIASATVAVRAGDYDEVRSLGEEHVRLAELSGDPLQIADSWVTHALSCFNHGLPHLGLMLLERAAELAGEHRGLRVRALALLNLSGTAFLNDVANGARAGRDAVAATREIGETYMAAFARANLAMSIFHAGDWHEMLSLTEAEDVRAALPIEADVLQRLVAIARGESWPAVSDAVPLDPESIEGPGDEAIYRLDLALEAYGAGRPDTLALALHCARTAEQASKDEFVVNWLLAGDIVRVTGDGPGLREMLEYVDDERGPWLASVRAQRARLRAVAGEDGSLTAGEVEDAYREALEAARVWGSVIVEAHICADLGAWLGRQGRGEEGAGLLAHAREVYERLGARRWLERLVS